jgi:cytochrome c biogenesis protein CcdA
MATLVRRLGLLSSIGIVIGITIGGGIFRTPAGIAARVPEPMWMLSVWIIGGLVVLCGALAFAELAASMPETGGMSGRRPFSSEQRPLVASPRSSASISCVSSASTPRFTRKPPTTSPLAL